MPENIVYRAFSQELPLQARELVTEIEVFPFSTLSVNKARQSLKIRAVWDTGATHTLITERVKTELNLFSVDSTRILGVNSSEKAEVVLVSIGLPNQVRLQSRKVIVADLNSPGIDMLIGMDIIRLGDCVISTGKHKIVFSFVIPPLPTTINLVDEAKKFNSGV